MSIRMLVVFGLATLGAVAIVPSSSQAADTAAVSGYAYDCGAQHALPGASISFLGASDRRTAVTDANGRFVLLGLVPGRYSVTLLDAETLIVPHATSVIERPAQAHQHARLSATRMLHVVPNDNVSMRIGAGAVSDGRGHVTAISCDPETVPVTPGPILRTTVGS